MEEILSNLAQVKGVQGTLIVGKDGLVIAQSGEIKTDPDFLGATIADFYSTAENIMEEKFECGQLGKICIESEQGKFFLNSINNETFLITIADHNSNIGLIRVELLDATIKLKEII